MAKILALPGVLSRRLLQSAGERDLLQRARDGDRESVALLLNRHREATYRLCFQILRDPDTAEDAAQEILLRAFEKMPQFRGESEFSTWLYRIALNHCLEIQRTLARRETLFEGGIEAHWPSQSGDFASRIDTRLALENALDSLPESLRIALILREWHHKSYEEIAAILSLPLGTVKSRLNQARREFRARWEAQNADQ